ncbi:cysteine proteinase [Piromyces finnis]|uniref:Ubiquitin carboxyl-terminal hydrolase n=1 Tax=Piromyces finnis TaxID=1754191 RepID=A0A1Y1V7W3_9FUNG|nr:cysteine proteinase [Piromyces finnis]|eukprot:ORX48630.1 cysteine proteinase [Piromyces finnis]
MTEKESNCENSSINFGEFTREDIDKIMVNGGYEKDPNDNEWIYKPKDGNLKKQLVLPRNKGRLEKEKDDIINNIKNKGLNPHARDFVPKNKEKTTPYVNQASTPYMIPVNFYYPVFQYYPQTPDMFYQMRVPQRNFTYGTYAPQEGMMPGNPHRMDYDMENGPVNGHAQVPFIPMNVPSTTMMQNMPGGRIEEQKQMMPMNEENISEQQEDHVENNKNQDVVIDIEASTEDLTETQEDQIKNEIIQNDESKTIKEDIDNEKGKKINVEKNEKESSTDKEQQQSKKKKNVKEKVEKTETEENQKSNEINKNKTINDKKIKTNEQQKKSKEVKEVNKNSYASKLMENTNKKKTNDKKKSTTTKSSKDNKSNESNDNDLIKEENKEEKEIKTENPTTPSVVSEENKEEKKEEVKKEESKPKSWASLFSKEDIKANATKTKINKVKVSATKTVPKGQTNVNEPVNLNDKIKISFEPVPIQPRGLVNNGNMCFMNAILQPLLYCPPFYNFIYSLKKETVSNMGKKPSIIESMIMFFDEFKVVKKKDLDIENYGESFLPEYVYNTLRKFNSTNSLQGRQEDAEEYLGFLLNGIHDEFVSKYVHTSNTNKKSESDGWMEVGPKNKLVVTREAEVKESPINKIFGGRIKSILKCPGTKGSATIEPFLSLQLDITPSDVYDIEDALENLTKPEIVPDYSVNGTKVSATKQNVIDGLPNVLLLHLKCFTFDHNTTQKVQKTINFKPVLEIQPDLLSPSLKNHGTYKYNLFAVVNHHGKMAGGGHYTCAVKQCNNRWLNFDDTKIKQTNELEVTTPNKNQLPYLLLYSLEQKK